MLGDTESARVAVDAEAEWARMGDNPVIYGLATSKSYTKAKDFLLKSNIESIFPKEIVERAFSFDQPFLEEGSIDELKNKYEAFKSGNPDNLNGSIFVETLKAKLSQLDTASLTDKDRKGLDDLLFLLDRIGEIKIGEARLLARLFDIL